MVEVGRASDKTLAFDGQARDVRLRCRDNIALRFERLGIAWAQEKPDKPSQSPDFFPQIKNDEKLSWAGEEYLD